MDIKIQARKRTQHHSERQKVRKTNRRFRDENINRVEVFSQPGEEGKKLRVHAYFTISADELEEIASIKLQVREHIERIKANLGYEYAGLYVDDDFSGTNVEHRGAFQIMTRHKQDKK